MNERRQEQEMISYCMKKGIKIYLQPITNTTGRIDRTNEEGEVVEGKVIFNTSKRRSKKEPKWEIAIKKGYEYYYNKLNKKDE